MRRAQFEILGLAIVVVIISMGVFFLISLSLNSPSSDPQGQFFDEQYTQNMLDAYLKTTHPECPRYTIQDYYQFQILPASSPDSACSDQDPTDPASINSSLQEVFDTTILQYQGVDYRFIVRENADNTCLQPICEPDQVAFDYGECEPLQTFSPGRQTIPKYPYANGQIEYLLWLCQR